MSLSILAVLTQIEFAKGKEKEHLIGLLHGDLKEKLKLVVEMTYRQGISYFITDVEKIKTNQEISSLFDIGDSLEPPTYDLFIEGTKFLYKMNAKGSASAEDKRMANTIYTMLKEDEAEVFRRIIRKDLKCGASIKTFRKVWGKDFCPDFPKSLCSPFNEKKIIEEINFWAYSQLKSDGARAQFIGKNSKSMYAQGIYTRNGSQISSLEHLSNICYETVQGKKVLDGELVVLDTDFKILPREKGNGIINKCIIGTAKLHEIMRVRFIVWDLIDIEEFLGFKEPEEPYHERYEELCRLVPERYFHNKPLNSFIVRIESRGVQNLSEAKKHYHEMIQRGEEGTILKDKDGLWGNKRLTNQFKFKEEHEIDAVVVGWYHGKKGSKYENYIGGFHCESRCGTVKFDVGSGLADRIRKSDGDVWIGKILECKYNYRTIVSDSEQRLFLPRVIEPRFDKSGRDEANSLEELISQEEASRQLRS